MNSYLETFHENSLPKCRHSEVMLLHHEVLFCTRDVSRNAELEKANLIDRKILAWEVTFHLKYSGNYPFIPVTKTFLHFKRHLFTQGKSIEDRLFNHWFIVNFSRRHLFIARKGEQIDSSINFGCIIKYTSRNITNNYRSLQS